MNNSEIEYPLKYCEKCGTETDPGSMFCNKCRSRPDNSGSSDSAISEKKNEESEKIKPGGDHEAGSIEAVATAEERKKKSNIKYYLASVLLILLIAGAYKIFFSSPDTPEGSVGTPASSADTLPGFVFIQGGTFLMGSIENDSDEKPVRSVNLSDFFIAKYEVTQGLWKSVMGNNPSLCTGDDNLPVESVTWYQAVEFCNKLSEKEGLQKVYRIDKNLKDPNNNNEYDYVKWQVDCDFKADGYRLPTEAEWEYAAKGGSRSQGYNYSGSNNAEDAAWYYYNSGMKFDYSGSKPHPVGQKKPNELGIYDMSGNVWEWCWDWYGDYSSGLQTNPTGPYSGSFRVIRGGSFYSGASELRHELREVNYPDYSYRYLGFRLLRSK